MKLLASTIFILSALLLLPLAYKLVSSSCPTVCICKWKGGKRRVECSNKSLTLILPGMSADTQVLDYNNNLLLYLPNELFHKMDVINLQKLYLSRCQIAQIHKNAFLGLANLVELDLADNTLTGVPSKSFVHLPLLMKLSLAGNPIDNIRARQFVSVPFLTTLDLSNCRLDDIESAAFEGLAALQWLRLDGNRLKTITNTASVMPEAVNSGLSLHPNPWTCDCRLRDFLRWLTAVGGKKKSTPLTGGEPICQEPSKYRDRPVRSLSEDELACLPSIVPSSSYVEIEAGKNISFVCQVSAIPEPTVSWQFEGIPIDNDDNTFYYYRVANVAIATADKVSELFIFDVAAVRNNGTYKCVAKNSAGNVSSAFTVRVLPPNVIPTPAPEPVLLLLFYPYMLLSSAVTLAIIAVMCALSIFCFLLRHTTTKRRQQQRRRQHHSSKSQWWCSCCWNRPKRTIRLTKKKVPSSSSSDNGDSSSSSIQVGRKPSVDCCSKTVVVGKTHYVTMKKNIPVVKCARSDTDTDTDTKMVTAVSKRQSEKMIREVDPDLISHMEAAAVADSLDDEDEECTCLLVDHGHEQFQQQQLSAAANRLTGRPNDDSTKPTTTTASATASAAASASAAGQRLYCNLQSEGGARLAVQVNPMMMMMMAGAENHQTISKTGFVYPCGCFYPIINDRRYECSNKNEQSQQTAIVESMTDVETISKKKISRRKSRDQSASAEAAAAAAAATTTIAIGGDRFIGEEHRSLLAAAAIIEPEEQESNEEEEESTFKKDFKTTPVLHLSQTSLKSAPLLSPPEAFKSETLPIS